MRNAIAAKGRRLSLALAILLAWMVLSGCSAKETERAPVEVKGRVVRKDKKPLAQVVLTFHPYDEANKGLKQLPAAVTDKDGSFKVACPPGVYKVTLAAIPSQSGGAPGGPSGTPGAPAASRGDNYRQAHTTPWEIRVPDGGLADLVLLYLGSAPLLTPEPKTK